MEKISVIIPVYNVEPYLEKCVQSVLKQTYKNLEIILVDDGSTDNSGKLCDMLAKIDERIKVIHKKMVGYQVQEMKQLKVFRGNLLHFLIVMIVLFQTFMSIYMS